MGALDTTSLRGKDALADSGYRQPVCISSRMCLLETTKALVWRGSVETEKGAVWMAPPLARLHTYLRGCSSSNNSSSKKQKEEEEEN